MLTAEIRVNCGLIGHMYIVNEGEINAHHSKYRYEYYTPDKKIKKGNVTHKYTDGALILIQKVIESINPKLSYKP